MKVLLRSDGAAWGVAFVAFLLNQAVNAGAGLYVAAHLDPASFGTVNIARTLLFLAATVMPLGLDLALQRSFATQAVDEARRTHVLGMLRTIPIVLSLAVLGLMAAGGANLLEMTVFAGPGFSAALLVTLIALPFWADLAVLGGAFRGRLDPLPSLIAQSIVQPLVRLIATVGLLHSGFEFWSLPGGLAAGYAAGWACLLPRARREFGFFRWPASNAMPELKAILRYSLPLGLALIGGSALRMTDVLMVGAFQSSAEAGRYAVTLLLAQLVALVGAASGQTLGPRIAESHARSDSAAIATLQRSNMALVALVAAPLLASILFWGDRITLLIGDAYRVDGVVLALLGVAAAITAVTGNLGHSLGMTGHHKAEAGIVWLALAAQLALCAVLVPMWGQTGAAIAVLVAVTALWLLRILTIYRRLNIVLLGLAPVYPFLAAVAIGLAVWLIDQWIGVRTITSTALACLLAVSLYGAILWPFRAHLQIGQSFRILTTRRAS